MNILTWIQALSNDESLKALQLNDKVILIQLGVIIPSLQGIFINLFASFGLIANDEYSDYEVQIFTSSLLVCCEMMILSFLQQMSYPVSEYKMGLVDKENQNIN
jgi:hypothetical protein